MSESKPTNWIPLAPGACYRVIHGNAELLVEERGDMFLVSLTDKDGKEIWTGSYPTSIGAKLAGIAAAKRLLQADKAVDAAKSEPEPAPSEAPSSKQESSQSIWRPTGLLTLVEGKGIVVTCIINILDDCVEGITKLGGYVFRQEYPDEWSAKRGTLQWASLLIERHA